MEIEFNINVVGTTFEEIYAGDTFIMKEDRKDFKNETDFRSVYMKTDEAVGSAVCLTDGMILPFDGDEEVELVRTKLIVEGEI